MEMMMDENDGNFLTSFEGQQQTPRRKRRRKTSEFSVEPAGVSRPAARRPDPHAPNITTPCPECYRTFWSWKALFGHMRCHPKRQYRGINPPENFHRRQGKAPAEEEEFKAEDYEVASYLLMLANGPPMESSEEDHAVAVTGKYSPEKKSDSAGKNGDNMPLSESIVGPSATSPSSGPHVGRFVCSSCKRVFNSHQALGGHRASHKNVKGCYAITKNDDDDGAAACCSPSSSTTGHKCVICQRIFTSGQALGGHLRCHWEKAAEDSPPSPPYFDLNLAADGGESRRSLFPEGIMLDLRLRL